MGPPYTIRACRGCWAYIPIVGYEIQILRWFRRAHSRHDWNSTHSYLCVGYLAFLPLVESPITNASDLCKQFRFCLSLFKLSILFSQRPLLPPLRFPQTALSKPCIEFDRGCNHTHPPCLGQKLPPSGMRSISVVITPCSLPSLQTVSV